MRGPMGEGIRAPQLHNMWDLRQPGFAFPDPVPNTRAPGKVTAGRVRRWAGAARAAGLGPQCRAAVIEGADHALSAGEHAAAAVGEMEKFVESLAPG